MVPFLSMVTVVRNQSGQLRRILERLTRLAGRASHICEVIVIDNASDDGSSDELRQLTEELPDLQVYVLSQKVSTKAAERVGLENALGDQVNVIDSSGKGHGARVLSRRTLNMVLQSPLRRGISVRFKTFTAFLGIICEPCHIAQEFGSTVKTRREKLNIEQAT
jgi:glycosyltransferase involved in cell wall biosynthesis